MGAVNWALEVEAAAIHFGGVQAVAGVQNLMVTELERFEISGPVSASGLASDELPSNSALQLGPFEIAQLAV